MVTRGPDAGVATVRRVSDAPKLKDFFTPEVVRSIGERVAGACPGFDLDAFDERVMTPVRGDPFVDLEFTARSRRIADAIDSTAGLAPLELLDALVASLPDELDGADGVLNDGFSLWPYGDLIGRHGPAHPAEGLAAARELTKRFTGEFAIRPILAASAEALAVVAGWAHDPNEHVRRLASEGTRPRLPWAQRLTLPLDEVLAILDSLRADRSLYVRKSVANHLNDLAKEHPDRIIELLAGWYESGGDETRWIVRHALRNHLKDGTPAALAIFGYRTPEVAVVALEVQPEQVVVGDRVEVAFELASESPVEQVVMVDIVLGYAKANGSISPKVFKCREFTLASGASLGGSWSIDMVQRSTRRLHAGPHTVGLRVNGVDLASGGFDLTADASAS